MEGLIRLVVESFVRHGLEVEPVADLQLSSPRKRAQRPTHLTPPTEALLEHNYRKMLEADLTTKV